MGRLNLTFPTGQVRQALASGFHYGFDIMDATGLPSGTVYPILRRLEDEALAASRWEDPAKAQREQRPPRRYYELTPEGRALAEQGRARYPMLAGMPARGKTRRA